MIAWTRVRGMFVAADRDAFCDPARVDLQFGFPSPYPERVFSSSLNEHRCSAVHEAGKQFRLQNFGNALAMRLIKAEDPAAWVWDERYHFCRDPLPPSMTLAQTTFLELLGDDRLAAIEARARAAGMTPRKHAKGRPDVATFSPGRDPEWRFIEVKVAGGKDRLNADQIKWLEVIADVLGPRSAIELEFHRVA